MAQNRLFSRTRKFLFFCKQCTFLNAHNPWLFHGDEEFWNTQSSECSHLLQNGMPIHFRFINYVKVYRPRRSPAEMVYKLLFNNLQVNGPFLKIDHLDFWKLRIGKGICVFKYARSIPVIAVPPCLEWSIKNTIPEEPLAYYHTLVFRQSVCNSISDSHSSYFKDVRSFDYAVHCI